MDLSHAPNSHAPPPQVCQQSRNNSAPHHGTKQGIQRETAQARCVSSWTTPQSPDTDAPQTCFLVWYTQEVTRIRASPSSNNQTSHGANPSPPREQPCRALQPIRGIHVTSAKLDHYTTHACRTYCVQPPQHRGCRGHTQQRTHRKPGHLPVAHRVSKMACPGINVTWMGASHFGN